jgi:hypothetical protein
MRVLLYCFSEFCLNPDRGVAASNLERRPYGFNAGTSRELENTTRRIRDRYHCRRGRLCNRAGEWFKRPIDRSCKNYCGLILLARPNALFRVTKM